MIIDKLSNDLEKSSYSSLIFSLNFYLDQINWVMFISIFHAYNVDTC